MRWPNRPAPHLASERERSVSAVAMRCIGFYDEREGHVSRVTVKCHANERIS